MLRRIDIGNAGTELPRWARTRGHRLTLDRIRTVECGPQGMVIKFGRYISPPDIEAQLAPDNYLYTHSLMFTFDCYTQTGINAAIKLNDQWSILFGIHAGDDIAPWNGAAHPTAMAMVRWASKSNNDSLWGGIDSLNGGKFKDGHDNLQQF